jgi:large subunit ribosomal protein L29
MKSTEIRDLDEVDLRQKAADARTDLFKLRFQLATGQLDNPQRIKAVKRDIARLHTELRSREIEAERKAAAS